ncbi:hypothetical protein LTR15_000103 [Elasticomyces elasticus]|nr:hypothetical protein LTR15_000103 [Elasticomyces elasticus]
MATGTINTAVRIQSLRGEEWVPTNEYAHLVSLLWYQASRTWLCPRCMLTASQLVAFLLRDTYGMLLVTNPRVVEHRDRFTNLVAHSSPLLIVSEGLGEDVSGYHARFEQNGAHEDFDLRDQKIYMDKTLIDRVYNAWRASFFPQSAMADANVFYIHAMFAVRMISHELAHVLTTYLFQGRQNTPPHVRGAAP